MKKSKLVSSALLAISVLTAALFQSTGCSFAKAAEVEKTSKKVRAGASNSSPPPGLPATGGVPIQYRKLIFPAGPPIAEIVWRLPIKARSIHSINGKERVLATGTVALPQNYNIEIILQYDALEHIDSLDQLALCQVTDFSAGRLEFTDAHMSHLKNFKHLTTLNLDQTLITDKSLPLIGTFTNLRELRLSDTDVTGESFDALASLHHLSHLNLYGTALKRGCLAKLKPIFPNLIDLDLTAVGMAKSEAALLQYLDNIVSLDLRGNKNLDDGCVKYFSKLDKLVKLSITDTAISDKSLSTFSQLPRLKTLVVRPSTFWTSNQPRAKIRADLEVVDTASRSRTPVEIFRPVH